jgi:hypothetical protein
VGNVERRSIVPKRPRQLLLKKRCRLPNYSQQGIQAIYLGEAVCYGDLLRIILKNGTLRFDGNQHGYDPAAFCIASGDTCRIPVGRGSRRQTGMRQATATVCCSLAQSQNMGSTRRPT